MHKPEERKRSLLKALTYRFIHMTADFFVAFYFTQETGKAIAIVLIVNTYSTVLYYTHERAWVRIPWGRVPAQHVD